MLNTQSIQQFDPAAPGVYAFRITDEVPKEDFHAMGETMNRVFDEHDKVDMLLVFDSQKGARGGAPLDGEVLKSQWRSLGNVRNYVVANAPDRAESMLKALDKVMPIEMKTFDTEAEALAFLRQQTPPAADKG